jgi:sugar lactone lactonase YvrE
MDGSPGVELVLDARAELGEGPVWDTASGRIFWVDITRGLVHRFDPATSSDEAIDVGRPVGAAVPTASGSLALAIEDGFAIMDPGTGRVDTVAAVAPAGTMMNDGTCDPGGRFWAGTKDAQGERPIGSLYRMDPDRTVVEVLTGIAISNGLAWSPDARTMYYIDSPTYGVDAFDFDPETADVSNRRRVVDLPRGYGLPDGMTIDEEGFLWVAFWSGSAVRRFAPDGRVVAQVRFPASQVTSCAFGGDDLSDLYVTSARIGLSPAQLEREPHAGGLFRLQPGVRGLPQQPFAG